MKYYNLNTKMDELLHDIVQGEKAKAYVEKLKHHEEMSAARVRQIEDVVAEYVRDFLDDDIDALVQSALENNSSHTLNIVELHFPISWKTDRDSRYLDIRSQVVDKVREIYIKRGFTNCQPDFETVPGDVDGMEVLIGKLHVSWLNG